MTRPAMVTIEMLTWRIMLLRTTLPHIVIFMCCTFCSYSSQSRHRYRRRRRRLCRLIACWNSFWGCCNISATANGINLNFNLLPRRQLKSCPGTWNPADPVEAHLQLPACYFISFHLFILSYLQNNCINKYFKERYAWLSLPPSPCIPVSGSPAPLRCPLRSLICCILITIARQVVHSSTRQSAWQMWLPVAAVAARLADCSDYLCVFLCACVQPTSCTCPTLITLLISFVGTSRDNLSMKRWICESSSFAADMRAQGA